MAPQPEGPPALQQPHSPADSASWQQTHPKVPSPCAAAATQEPPTLRVRALPAVEAMSGPPRVCAQFYHVRLGPWSQRGSA